MNPTDKKNAPGATRITQPFNRQAGSAAQLKPAVAQLKTAVSAPSVKRPVAPPVYRPQQVPKVLQTKSALAPSPRANQSPRGPVAPPVYRPEPKKLARPNASQTRQPLAAPQAYRPSGGAQPKQTKTQSGHAAQMKPAAKKAPPPSPFPARKTAVQAMETKLNAVRFTLVGHNIPEGVQEKKNLGNGYGVGYDATNSRVVLYDTWGVLAHVEIAVPESFDRDIILHTRTDKGKEGGQGYMMAMFPVALRIIQEHYSQYAGIAMTPAPGAATKGLISLISRLRKNVQPTAPIRGIGNARMILAHNFLETADKMKVTRQTKEKTGERKKPVDPQAFDSDAMLETAVELNALREMEWADPMGMMVHGTTGKYAENLVGIGSFSRDGGALGWHKSAQVTGQATLYMTLPMASLPRLIAALPN